MDLEFHQLETRYESLRVRRRLSERRLLASLADRGQQVPIVVIALGDCEPQRFLVIDGYKRLRALKRLGEDTVQATVWDLSQTEALLLDRCLRTAQGQSALEQGWLLRELAQTGGLSLEEMARRLDRSPSWVSRRLALVRELPEAVQDLVRQGKIGAHAAMRFLVPLARAKLGLCEQLAQTMAQHQLTSREVQGLCLALGKTSSLELLKRCLADPRLFLRVQQELEAPPVVASPLETFLVDVDRIATLARRSQERFATLVGALDDSQQKRLLQSLERTRTDLNRLYERVETTKQRLSLPNP